MINTIISILLFNLLGTGAIPIPTPIKHCKENILVDNRENTKIPDNIDSRLAFPNLLVDIKFFVIHNGNTGKLTYSQMDKQIAVLNKGYQGNHHSLGTDSKIEFRRKAVQYINNANLYEKCGEVEESIISTYRGSSDKYISIYTCNDDYLGYAYYPWYESEGHYRQVVFMSPHVFPDGNYQDLNLGMTLVHELGHYFGLKHTFTGNGKCDDKNDDGFTDTPLEKSPNFYCNLNRDTCPNSPGNDPIWNYMDYTPDGCMNRFTPQQVNYMVYVIKTERPKLKALSIQNYDSTYRNTPNPTPLPTPLITPSPTPLITPSPTSLPSPYPTYKPTPTPTDIYQYCDVRKQGDGKPDRNMCLSEKYNNVCKWHDYYIKCMPLEHTDQINIFCDVRQNGNQAWPSKWKCLQSPYNDKCDWDENNNICLPVMVTDTTTTTISVISEYCDVRQNNNPELPSKWKCLREPYLNSCFWDDKEGRCQTQMVTTITTNSDTNKYCDVRQNNNPELPSKWKCLREPYLNSCFWDDEEGMCQPQVETTTTNNIIQYCDVRQNNNPELPSKWKCLRDPYLDSCLWDEDMDRCIPKN